MNICYLLESTELCGGVRVVFDQARALEKRGHEVLIRAAKGDHRWYPHHMEIAYVSELSSDFSDKKPAPEIVIATFWTTVRHALILKSALKFHLCQGYEGDIPEYSAILPEIKAAYNIPIPKITIGKWLSDRLTRIYGTNSFNIHTVGQIVDLDIFKPSASYLKQIFESTQKIKILISGIFESSVKGIPTALHAVRLLRGKGVNIHLIRVSPWKLSETEADITPIDEYHTSIPPAKMATLYQKSNLFLAPSLSGEGFGLPFAEALACGLPTVATAIPSHISFDVKRDYACFVPEDDPQAMAAAALAIIKDSALQKHLTERGLEVVNRNFRSDIVAERLEYVFLEAFKRN